MTVAQPLYRFAQPRELSDAMRRATDDMSGARTRRDRDAGLASGAAPTGHRLTMTVEEAATALGISRALAYESVQRGDIPCVRIGHRILVPRSRLMKLLDAVERRERIRLLISTARHQRKSALASAAPRSDSIAFTSTSKKASASAVSDDRIAHRVCGGVGSQSPER